MVMLEEVAMSRAFGEDVGRYFHEVMESNGIDLVPGDPYDKPEDGQLRGRIRSV